MLAPVFIRPANNVTSLQLTPQIDTNQIYQFECKKESDFISFQLAEWNVLIGDELKKINGSFVNQVNQNISSKIRYVAEKLIALIHKIAYF